MDAPLIPPRRVSRAQRERQAALKVLAAIFLALFLCGALFFAFQIFETARQAVLVLGAPDLSGLNEPIFGASNARTAPPNIAAC